MYQKQKTRWDIALVDFKSFNFDRRPMIHEVYACDGCIAIISRMMYVLQHAFIDMIGCIEYLLYKSKRKFVRERNKTRNH